MFSELWHGSCFKSFWQVTQTLLINASLRHPLKTQAGQSERRRGFDRGLKLWWQRSFNPATPCTLTQSRLMTDFLKDMVKCCSCDTCNSERGRGKIIYSISKSQYFFVSFLCWVTPTAWMYPSTANCNAFCLQSLVCFSKNHITFPQGVQLKTLAATSINDGSLFLPSSLSLYRSGSELPLWLTFMSVRTSSGSRGCAGPLSSSFCSFFSYSLRVDA